MICSLGNEARILKNHIMKTPNHVESFKRNYVGDYLSKNLPKKFQVCIHFHKPVSVLID